MTVIIALVSRRPALQCWLHARLIVQQCFTSSYGIGGLIILIVAMSMMVHRFSWLVSVLQADARPMFIGLNVARSDGGCGGGGCQSFSSATGWITANIPEDYNRR